ncbi:MAG: hypothetical protein R3F33_10730 [Planctomycetota bacterium]
MIASLNTKRFLLLPLLAWILPFGPATRAFAQTVEPLVFDDDEPEEEAPEVAPVAAANPDTWPEALKKAVTDLESRPNDPAALKAVVDQALAAGEKDVAAWHLQMALGLVGEDQKDLLATLQAAEVAMSLPGAGSQALIEEYGRGLFDMARACQKKKLYTNAVDLLQLCYGTPLEVKAEARLTELFDKKTAVEGLLASGIPIDIPVQRKVNEKKKRLVDRKNNVWESFYEVKGKYYILRSDMGYEFTHAFLDAMEQINAFYREVFGYKTRGGTMRSCTIEVYKNREEFDRWELEKRGRAIDKGVRGFFVPDENRVATYDPREEGGTIGDLWSTLFHEASHQFTRIVAPELKLTWLNEGTASYFEGAFLQPGGSVATNRIPEGRLASLAYQLKEEPLPLDDVLTYYQPGSYPGEYYSYGWGLVYYIHNYEDAKSERIYLPIYADFLASYKNVQKHTHDDIRARFKEYFIDRAAVPGVTDQKQFETHWNKWIEDLAAIYFGGPEQAQVLLERARVQRKNGKPGYARESLIWGLEKDPQNAGVRLELAEVLNEMGRVDEAVYHWRRLEAAARQAPAADKPLPSAPGRTAAELRTLAEEQLLALDPTVGTGLRENVDRYVTGALAAAKEYREAGFPRTALFMLSNASRLVSGDARLAEAEAAIQGETGLRLTRGYRPKLDGELVGWSTTGDWAASGGELTTKTKNVVSARLEDPPPVPFRFEADFNLSEGGNNPVVGLSFAGSQQGQSSFVWMPEQEIAGLFELTKDGQAMKDAFPVRPEPGKRKVSHTRASMAIEITGTRVTMFINGQMVGFHDVPFGKAAGQVGLFVQDTGARISNVRLVY